MLPTYFFLPFFHNYDYSTNVVICSLTENVSVPASFLNRRRLKGNAWIVLSHILIPDTSLNFLSFTKFPRLSSCDFVNRRLFHNIGFSLFLTIFSFKDIPQVFEYVFPEIFVLKSKVHY